MLVALVLMSSSIHLAYQSGCEYQLDWLNHNFLSKVTKGHVTRSNFSCNLQRNKRYVASCKLQEKFTCNTPFCNCNCCVASCKKSRTTLYFSQRCETSCLRVTSAQQLATQFCKNGPIRAHLLLAGDFKMRPPSCLLLYALQVAKKFANVWHPLCNLKGFLFVIVALQVARKIASCNMALSNWSNHDGMASLRNTLYARTILWLENKVPPVGVLKRRYNKNCNPSPDLLFSHAALGNFREFQHWSNSHRINWNIKIAAPNYRRTLTKHRKAKKGHGWTKPARI